MRFLLPVLAPLAALVGFAAAAAQDVSPAAKVITTHDRVAIAAQPDVSDLDVWAADGATLVVNLRSREETDGLPFDESQAVIDRGMAYLDIPVGGADGVSSEAVSRLARALADHPGPVVLHCRSGMRAAHVYAAHLMASGELAPDRLDEIGYDRPWSNDMLDKLGSDDACLDC